MEEEQKINLGAFEFNVDEVVQAMQQLKAEINELSKNQKQLAKDGKDTSAVFIEQEVKLGALKKEYNVYRKALSDVNEETKEQETRTARLEAVLSQEVKTIEQARAQNKELNKLRNTANLLTAEGIEEVEKLNNALDANNAFIKDNVDAYTQQKINIGNYKESISEALDELNLFNGGVQNLQQNFLTIINSSQEAGGATAFFGNSAKNAVKGVVGLTKATLAFLATPIGVVLGLIGAAFLLVQNALNRSEASTNKLKKAFAPLSALFSKVLKALEPLGEVLIDGIVAGFELAEKAALSAMKAFANVAQALGFDSLAENVRSFTDSIEETIEASRRLADQEAQLVEEKRKYEEQSKRFLIAEEKERQIRDDVTKSIEERIAANDRLAQVLDEQAKEQIRVAQLEIDIVNQLIELDGERTELLDRRAEALTKIADVEESVNGFRSEQLAQRNALEQEAFDKRQAQIDKEIEKNQESLDLFIAQQGDRARTLSEQLQLDREVAEQKIKNLDYELEQKRISEKAYATAILEIKRELARQEAEIAVDSVRKQIELNQQRIDREREQEMFLSAQQVEIEKARNNQILADQQRLAEAELENGLINTQEFNDRIRELKESNRIANEEIDKERKAIEKEEADQLALIEFEESLVRLQEQNASALDIEQALAKQRYSEELSALQASYDNKEISEELYQKKKNQIANNYEKQKLDFKKQLDTQYVESTIGMLDIVSGIIDENSAGAKAIAIAKALYNTYQGITAGVALGFPQAIPAVAFAATTGFKAVKDIMKTPTPSSSGQGNVGGGSSSVSNVSGLGSFQDTSSLGVTNLGSSGVNLTEVAGSGNAVSQSTIENAVNVGDIANAVEAGAERGAQAGTATGANEGITNLSENRRILAESTFD